MWLFKRRKKNEEDTSEPSVSDKMAGKIAVAGIKLQTAFANKMNELFRNMNSKKLKTLLIIFCLVAGGYSIYLFVNAFVNTDKESSGFKVDQIHVPEHFNKSGDGQIPEANVEEETYNKIQDYKRYMDSLKQTKNYLYDSIITARPFLMDTVLMLEEIYQSQKQK
ncbi:MAG: hypothetical protein KF825_06765 [Ferruginibacter sp.]|nr:hypothetical protein [Ferruginibacter sp.]